MFPRSGGEKVYLEAVYTRPKFLATIVFATQAILLGFTGRSSGPDYSARLGASQDLDSVVANGLDRLG